MPQHIVFTLPLFLLFMQVLYPKNSVRQRIATTEFWSNGIVYITIHDNAEVQLEDTVAQHRILKDNFDGNKKYKLLIEFGKYTTISTKAREFSAKAENNNVASAVIVKSLAQRIIINFIVNQIRKNNFKIRMFDSKEKAINWLLSYKN